MQTPKQSMIEALAGTAIGWAIAMACQIFITWWYEVNTSLVQDAWITLFFTGISILRSYWLRRFFNWFFHKEGK